MKYAAAILILGTLILLHEFGHFIAARLMKIPVAIFSVGFGPAIWKRKIGETEFRLSLIPIGGYVLPDVEDEDDFFKIPINKRIVFSSFGPLVNLILPLFVFGIINVATKGFSLFNLFILPFVQTWAACLQVLSILPIIITNPRQLSGIVGIAAQGGAMIAGGYVKTLYFTAMISINLAVMNLLPIPVMDGGKIILALLEKVHPKAVKLHYPLALAGWVLLMGLMIYVTVLDIGRYFV